jgi:hypothetical protein
VSNKAKNALFRIDCCYVNNFEILFAEHLFYHDRLCGLVVRVSGFRSRGLGSIPGATRFLRSSGSGTGSTQLVSTIEKLLKKK